MTNESQKKIPHIYFENLDALRFIAAFSVFIFHFFADIKGLYPQLRDQPFFDKLQIFADKGSLGVNFFFVLSGFLITYLILHEKKYTRRFNLGKFLIRRTLRIWPLYFLVILIGFVLFPLLFSDYHTTHDPRMYVLFLANFDEIIHGAHDPINFLTAPWSIAVEEQFYLFWGISLFLLFRIRQFKIMHLIVLMYVISFIFRYLYMDHERILYYHTLAVCQDILSGAFIGLALFHKKKWLDTLKKIKQPWVILIYCIGLTLCLAKNKIFSHELIVLERLVLSAFFAFVILDQVRGEHSFFKFGKIKLFNYLGKISYGLYMYHLIVMYLLLRWLPDFEASNYAMIPIYFISSLSIIILVASMSYYMIERPLLRLKPKSLNKKL
ncbi:MAG: acyltransferase [Crocinitomicaceae bacterium]